MEGIFISYRRDDSAGYAGRLYDRLVAHFGADSVFMDVEGIEPGTDFVKAIEGAVASCKVLIVLIGNQWMGTADASGQRRLDDPHDFIRLETSTALARDIRVVPVLVDRAPMPKLEDLPKDLESLVRRQAVELNHKQWDATSGELIKTLEKILGVAGEHSPGGAGPEQADNRTQRSGSGKTLWIAAAVLVILMAASFVYWMLSPVDEQWAHQNAPPLVKKAQQKAPAAPEIAGQPMIPAEVKPQRAPQPKLIEPPAEKPVTAITAEALQPTPPPSIATLTSTPEKGGASVCYRVLNAHRLSLTPLPGTLSNTGEACVSVALDQATGVTLTAEGKGGSSNRSITAAPLPPPPAAPKVVEKPKPVLPPVISSLTTKTNKAGVSVCYQVARAHKLRLTPMPGDLKNPVKECVSVALEKPTSFTLSATGPGGSSSQRITVSPHPDTLARIEQNGKLPGKGESWVYRTQGKWPASPQWKFKITVGQADTGGVSESMTILEPAAKGARSRSSSGGNAGFVSWPDIGLEFSPWMGAYTQLSGKESWKEFPTPAIGGWDKWFSSASISEREQVKVLAGSFDAWKVEVWSNRRPTGGSTMASLEPVRMQYLVWYAPKIKRYVKSVRKSISADGTVLEEDLFELVEYTPN